MAFTVTSQGNILSNTRAQSHATGAFTPSADVLLVALLTALDNDTGTGGVVSISGHGTWAQIGTSQAWDDANSYLEVWGCIVGGSPSSSVVTLDSYGDGNDFMNFIAAEVWQVEGADVSGTIANAFGTPAGNATKDGGGGPHTMTATLAAFDSATNLTMVIKAVDKYNTTAFTEEGGYTIGTTRQTAGDGVAFACSYLAAEDTSPSMADDHTFTFKGLIAVEVMEAAGGAKEATGDVDLVALTASGAVIQTQLLSGTPSLEILTASGVAGIASSVTITDVDGDESWTDGDTGLVITGTGFI